MEIPERVMERNKNICQESKSPNRDDKPNQCDEERGDVGDYGVAEIFMYIRHLHARYDNAVVLTNCRNDGIITREGTALR